MKLESTQRDVETLQTLVEQTPHIETLVPPLPRKNLRERLTLFYQRVTQRVRPNIMSPRALFRLILDIRTINRGVRRLLRLNWMEEQINNLTHELHQLREDTARQAQLQAFSKQIEETNLRTIHLERQLNEALERLGSIPMVQGGSHETWYVALEQALRGEPSMIQSRQQQYLPLILPLKDTRDTVKVLDIGCGRGEWIALLHELGMEGVGIDTDAGMLTEARAHGHNVHLSDATDYLAQSSDNTWDVISAFHVAEHLPLPVLLNLLAEAWRTLSPGGLLILETPNPENIQVGAYSFWLDPTHVRPLPPPLLANLAAHYGFVDIQIIRANPWPQYQPESTEPDSALNKLLYCEQDYALIARRP